MANHDDEQPYRRSTGSSADKDELRDTGRMPRIPDEAAHMSSARTFDNLVESNLKLAPILRWAVIAMVVSSFTSAVLTGASAYILHHGQQETRELLLAISQRPRLCTEVKKETSQ